MIIIITLSSLSLSSTPSASSSPTSRYISLVIRRSDDCNFVRYAQVNPDQLKGPKNASQLTEEFQRLDSDCDGWVGRCSAGQKYANTTKRASNAKQTRAPAWLNAYFQTQNKTRLSFVIYTCAQILYCAVIVNGEGELKIHGDKTR